MVLTHSLQNPQQQVTKFPREFPQAHMAPNVLKVALKEVLSLNGGSPGLKSSGSLMASLSHGKPALCLRDGSL